MDVEVQQALLEWINTFPLQAVVPDLRSLSSGEEIWEVLCSIDSEYFSGELPESTENTRKTWSSRWENLKHVYEYLVLYLKERQDEGATGNHPKSLPKPDLKAIAMDSDPNNSIQAGRYGRLIQRLKEGSEDNIDELDRQNGTLSPPLPGVDPELQFEEHHSRVMAENASLKRTTADLQLQLQSIEERYQRLQYSSDALRERLTKAEDGLERSGSAHDAKDSFKLLESKIEQQAEVITNLEDDLAESRSNKEAMKRTVDRLRDSSSKAEKLQDELDVVKAERDGYAKKANAAEKYKQKIQAGQDLQKENAGLREELLEVRELYQGAEQDRQQLPGLQRAVEDYKRVLEKVEQEHYELQQMKRQLEFDNKALAKRWDAANDQHTRDQDSIADLSERLRALGGDSPSGTANQETGGVENELAEPGETEQLQRRLTEQRKEIQRLRSVEGELKGELDQFQKILGDVREGHDERERLHLSTYEEMLGLRSSLVAVQQGQQVNETESYRTVLTKLDEEQTLRAKLNSQMENLKKELETSQQDLSLVDKDKRTVLNEVKNRQSTELINVQEENKALRKRLLDVETDFASHRKVFQSNIGNQNPPINQDYSEEILKTINSIKDAVTTRPARSVEDFEKDIAALGEKMLQSNAALAKSEEHIKKQRIEIQEMQTTLRRQADQKPISPPSLPVHTPPAKTRNEREEGEEKDQDSISQAQYIANLERENRLMASAYHTLAEATGRSTDSATGPNAPNECYTTFVDVGDNVLDIDTFSSVTQGFRHRLQQSISHLKNRLVILHYVDIETVDRSMLDLIGLHYDVDPVFY
ncbi:hypothetical protein G7Y79_00001g004490 [Physcia stellaris]|nr:hypothetical protein G7Y79_00001g004490 [Physcia stellaris]